MPRKPASTRLTALIVAAAMFMEMLDGTVLATALPAMAKSFHADPLQMSVALTSYLLSLAVFIPPSGKVADRLGSRTVFRAAIALFTLGSILCGVSQNLPFLVAARIVQGIGGAMMVPVGRLVLLRTIPKAELVSAMAWLLIPATIGPVVGPPVGGFIVTYLNWRWIFGMNVPIGLAGIVLVTRYIDEIKEPQRRPFDLPGLGLTAVSLVVPDVRPRDGHPRRRFAAGDGGAAGHRGGGGRALSASRGAPCRSDPRSAADAHPHLPHLGLCRRLLADRGRRDAVPAADDAATGLRPLGGGERDDHLRLRGRLAADARDRAADAAPARLSQHADLGGRVLDLAARRSPPRSAPTGRAPGSTPCW